MKLIFLPIASIIVFVIVKTFQEKDSLLSEGELVIPESIDMENIIFDICSMSSSIPITPTSTPNSFEFID